MGEPARGMERTSTFAGMWRAEASRRGGCWESRALDRRGQATAAVNCSRCRSGDRAENGCAMVLVGSGAREVPTHGVPGGGRSVAGCGRQPWCVVRVGGGWSGWAVQSWALGVGGVWWWWVRPATGVLLRGSDEGEDCSGTEAGEPGAGEWGAGGGLSPAGMAGVPWGPVGAEDPHVGWVRNLGLFFRHRSS